MRCSQAGALWSERQLLCCGQALMLMAGGEPSEQGRTSWERELRVQQNQSRQLDSTTTSTVASAMPTTSSVLRLGPRLTQLAV